MAVFQKDRISIYGAAVCVGVEADGSQDDATGRRRIESCLQLHVVVMSCWCS